MIGALVDRVPHSCMSYEDNLNRMSFKFAEMRTAKTDMHQLYLDGHPIGSVVAPEKREALFYWLGTALPDLEKAFRSASRGAGRPRKSSSWKKKP